MIKTVYILGAGFSKGLGSPLQSELIKNIFDLDESLLEPAEGKLFQDCRINFKDFLENNLFISPHDFSKISLEDIYTPIDRCIIDNLSFRNFNKSKLVELRQKINTLIILIIRHKLSNSATNNYSERFAKYLVDIKRKMKIELDPFSILSLNWDIIMDNALKNALNNYYDDKNGVIDYCCHVTPFRKNENIIPGLLARGRGMFNIKLLKMHGSMNWLQCQQCQRLFVTFYEKIAIEEYLSKPHCRLCKNNFTNENNGGALLISQLIMPTFLKDLNNVQLKLIWQNAGIELSEANKIVFMGYSFPSADFELRQLLARFVRHNAEIEVVLKDSSKSF